MDETQKTAPLPEPLESLLTCAQWTLGTLVASTLFGWEDAVGFLLWVLLFLALLHPSLSVFYSHYLRWRK
ncbi:MAG TPA: hypothetical protein VFQ43_08885 [Nitrososphaera sp.]|nr:hypothetical protein [Nitrososphaera sp.]